MPFVNQRWLGGMLTNFATVAGRVKRMVELRGMERAGDFENMPKREALRHSRELEKLDRNLSGIAKLDRVPDAIFVIDTKKEHIAVTEARKLGLPVVAVVDTNCDPDVIDYVIPGNDDAIRSGALLCRLIADAVTEGRFIRANRPTIVKNASAVTSVAESTPFVTPTPVTDVPAAETAPVAEAPVVEAPVVEAPVVEAPVVEAPVVEAPFAEAAPVVESELVAEDTPVEETVAPEANDAPVSHVEAPAETTIT
jgi:small subunit ribosomal protein S2